MGETPSLGYLLTTYNDLDLSKGLYEQIVDTTPTGASWALIVVDAGSTDGTIKYWSKHAPVLHRGSDSLFGYKPDDLQHLSVALNLGIDYLLRKDLQYVSWIHADMEFPQENWAYFLMHRIFSDDSIGKMGPNESKDKKKEERPGNTCPWVMSAEVLRKMPEFRKEVHWQECRECVRKHLCRKYFCEKYIGIGGYEDWDFNKILVEKGYKILITPDAYVVHEGMGTRSRRDTNPEAWHNNGIYGKRFRTGEPPV